MTITRAARSAGGLLLVLALAACAERPGPGGSDTPPPTAAPTSDVPVPAAAGDLVLRVEHVGGFTTPQMLAARLPVVSAYADGRVISEGPVIAIYPAPAWPNVQVADIGPGGVQELADRALAAGVAGIEDLGRPPIADATSTRFTVVTDDDTHVRDVYALGATSGLPGADPGRTPAGGLTPEQEAARAELSAFLDELTAMATAATSEPYIPDAVAALVSPWTDPGDDLEHRPVPWPGPELPGEPIGPLPDLTCVVATGEEATAVITAAQDANGLTPWSSGGAPWSVAFRPLLPDERWCADLVE